MSGRGSIAFYPHSSLFSYADDQLLMDLAEEHGDRIPWTKASAEVFDSRFEPGQLRQRYHRVLAPDRTKLTPEEDFRLRMLVDKHGRKWAVIARKLSQYCGRRRCDVWCRQRWMHLVAKSGHDEEEYESARSPIVTRSMTHAAAPTDACL